MKINGQVKLRFLAKQLILLGANFLFVSANHTVTENYLPDLCFVILIDTVWQI